MDPARRHRYLRALGVETYVRRGLLDAASLPPEASLETPKPPNTPNAPTKHSGVGDFSVSSVSSVSSVASVFSSDAFAKAPPAGERVGATAPALREPAPAPYVAPAEWEPLQAAVRDCRRCKLCSTRTQTVFGVGPRSAPLMVVGEGPGADEDAQGEPFVGRAGKLLDEMLAAIGRSRKATTADAGVYIANVVKCRPPGNRDPETDEVEACRPYLEQQIRLVRPRLIVGLGRIAAQRLLATDAPLSRLRGPLYHYGPERTPLFITYHPAYLLRSPREKARSWDDLKKVWRFLRDAQGGSA